MNVTRPLSIALCLVLAAPAGAQVFEAWQGKDNVQPGGGGTKKVVDGIDFWTTGGPACRFRILGYVHDTRRKLDLFGLAGNGGNEPAVAKAARAAGGEAVYLVSSTAESVGGIGGSVGGSSYHGGGSTGVAVGLGAQIKKIDARYAVVKCVPDEPPAEPPPASEVPAQAASEEVPATAPESEPAITPK
jgi:hypothetical protein